MFKQTENQENKKNFMEQLDAWSEQTIIGPLHLAWKRYFDGSTDEDEAHDESEAAMEAVKKAIREKVLESYHNGQGVGARPTQRRAYAHAQRR